MFISYCVWSGWILKLNCKAIDSIEHTTATVSVT